MGKPHLSFVNKGKHDCKTHLYNEMRTCSYRVSRSLLVLDCRWPGRRRVRRHGHQADRAVPGQPPALRRQPPARHRRERAERLLHECVSPQTLCASFHTAGSAVCSPPSSLFPPTAYGNVVELRINTKGVGGKLPNFGFVVFDDAEPVQRILGAKVAGACIGISLPTSFGGDSVTGVSLLICLAHIGLTGVSIHC